MQVTKINEVQTYGKLPPQNIEAEMSLLGAMMRDNRAIGDTLEIIDKNDFYRIVHRIIYEVIVNLYDKRQAIDVVTLKDELEKIGKLEEIGGAEYLVTIHEAVPNVANAVHYAKSVHDKASLRYLVETCNEIIGMAFEGEKRDAESLLDEAERKIFEAVKKKSVKAGLSIGDILSEVFHKIELVRDRKARLMGIPTGFYEIDDTISGFQPGQLIVIAGRPSMGKSSLAINLAEQISLNEHKAIHFFSLEMTKEQVAQIMLCSHCKISPFNVTSGKVSDEEIQRLLTAASRFQETPIFIDDSSDLSILELRARARRFKAEHNTDLIIIDYLQQLYSQDRRVENRQQEIALISRNLKSLAKELNIPVIALAQLNRSPEREDREPRLSDLRESGAIEQDADVVILLHREERYNPDTDKKGICDVNVAKNRTGPIRKTELAFMEEYMKFAPLKRAET